MECAHDARAAYVRLYAANIDRLRRNIDRIDAAQAAWIEQVMLAHAHRYLGAVASWDSGDSALLAEPWRAAFALARGTTDTRVVTELSAAVHVSYELPLALARVPLPASERGHAREAYLTAVRGLAGGALLRRAWDDAMALVDASGDGRAFVFARIEGGVMRSIARRTR